MFIIGLVRGLFFFITSLVSCADNKFTIGDFHSILKSNIETNQNLENEILSFLSDSGFSENIKNDLVYKQNLVKVLNRVQDSIVNTPTNCKIAKDIIRKYQTKSNNNNLPQKLLILGNDRKILKRENKSLADLYYGVMQRPELKQIFYPDTIDPMRNWQLLEFRPTNSYLDGSVLTRRKEFFKYSDELNDSEKFLMIITHGTFGKMTPSFVDDLNPQMQNYRHIKRFATWFGIEHKKNIDLVSFKWSGKLFDSARFAAAEVLNSYVTSHYPNIPLVLLAHSHGCNIHNKFSQLTSNPIELMIHLACPKREPSEEPDYEPKNFNQLVYFHAKNDVVEPAGRLDKYKVALGVGAVGASLMGVYFIYKLNQQIAFDAQLRSHCSDIKYWADRFFRNKNNYEQITSLIKNEHVPLKDKAILRELKTVFEKTTPSVIPGYDEIYKLAKNNPLMFHVLQAMKSQEESLSPMGGHNDWLVHLVNQYSSNNISTKTSSEIFLSMAKPSLETLKLSKFSQSWVENEVHKFSASQILSAQEKELYGSLTKSLLPKSNSSIGFSSGKTFNYFDSLIQQQIEHAKSPTNFSPKTFNFFEYSMQQNKEFKEALSSFDITYEGSTHLNALKEIPALTQQIQENSVVKNSLSKKGVLTIGTGAIALINKIIPVLAKENSFESQLGSVIGFKTNINIEKLDHSSVIDVVKYFPEIFLKIKSDHSSEAIKGFTAKLKVHDPSRDKDGKDCLGSYPGPVNIAIENIKVTK